MFKKNRQFGIGELPLTADMTLFSYISCVASAQNMYEYMQIYAAQILLSFLLSCVSYVASAQQAYHCLRMSPCIFLVPPGSKSTQTVVGRSWVQIFSILSPSTFHFVHPISWEAWISCPNVPKGQPAKLGCQSGKLFQKL